MTTRPLDVIEADIKVTRIGLRACEYVVAALLDQRRTLLALGFPVEHAMCERLDQDAAYWAAQRDHCIRTLGDLEIEANHDDG